jgi:alkanesulfonate monooxygenase SsuD/methylene tetrahydromethanopterin reductase-like flavin-dependent oxidoreductase (luciferase family)
MRVGVGLPTSTPDAGRDLLLEWARRADAGPFTSVGVIDRLVYDCWDPLAALAAAATVTSTVALVTMVVIGPLRDTAVLAEQATAVDALSNGRLVLGLGLGARADDYEAAGVDRRRRGAALTGQLVELRHRWEDNPSTRAGGPPLLVGGANSAAYARAARHADGYVHGGGPARGFAAAAARVRAAWVDAGRPGRPRLWAQAYFALGSEAAGAAYLRDYYRFTGGFEERIAAGCLTTPAAVRDFVRGYEEEGCDELVLLPTVSDLDQLDRLAEAVAP